MTINERAAIVLRMARRRYGNDDDAANAVAHWWQEFRGLRRTVPDETASKLAWRSACVAVARGKRFGSPRPARCTRLAFDATIVTSTGDVVDIRVPGYVDAAPLYTDRADRVAASHRQLCDDRCGRWSAAAIRDAQEFNALADL